MTFFTDNPLGLDKAFDPRQTLQDSDLWFDYFKEDTAAMKRARLAKLAERLPSPPEDREPF